MKFAAIACIASTVSAAALATKLTCTAAADCNKDAADTDNCCGYYLSKDKKTVVRQCGKKAGTVIGADATKEAGYTYACTELKVEGASKLALGLSAVAAALYMA